jgi:hypothetical protein
MVKELRQGETRKFFKFTEENPSSESFPQLAKKLLSFYETRILLPFPQEPGTVSCPNAYKSSLPPILLIQYPFLVISFFQT